ncbi:hypothetical protein [Parapedobacter tibetensis]|uniref:hypothetical protein n=1 Tax=Parapedobacter tibetensis TaxID=2972951 RepID=UPI00214D5F44|nr:hypothetical protein [Parapedobacter tibetensis]
MYDIRPNLLIGFHGCDAAVCHELINKPDKVKLNKEPFDWLGHGIYFWENNYERALQWAKDKHKRGRIKEPAVVGAVLQLGLCCDFLDSKYIKILQDYYASMEESYRLSDLPLPKNRDLPNDEHKDRILRELDCAAIEYMHARIDQTIQRDMQTKGFSDYRKFDSTRGVFTEGGPAFSGAGIFEKSHIQVCVRNVNCIKGFFLPRKEIDFK